MSKRNYVLLVTRARALDFLRGFVPPVAPEGELENLAGEDEIGGVDYRLTLDVAIEKCGLTDIEREVLRLHLAELTDDEIAAILGMKKGTVGSHLSRARAKLRRWLKENDA